MCTLRATARLQLHKDFTFDQAAEVVPYYAALGISHIYASPILTARSGSTHGYDIVDPTRINAELGGEEGLRNLVKRIREAGLGLILDIVPNHMGVGPENPWWQHVLEWGQHSPYAQWFDIDWNPADETLHGKVMAPFLGQPYGDVLHAGDIKLQYNESRGKFFISYFSHCFPVTPSSYAQILQTAKSERLAPILALLTAGDEVKQDAHHDAHKDAPQKITQQHADSASGLLRELGLTSEGQADIEAVLRAFSGNTEQGQRAMHTLLERQHYRLAWWRCAADGINWRRFFEVTDLAGVRVEQDDVFEATHALIFRLYTEGLIDGVRIDHVDGLADPGAYCRKLRRRLQALSSQRPSDLPPAPAYVIVEKILAPDEQLRTNWEIDGTSGYDFMDRVGALLHDPAGQAPLTALWKELTEQEQDFQSEVRQARRQLLTNNLAGEFEATSRALHAVARTDLRTRDYSLGAIRRVFTELLVHFPVYRTYADLGGRDETDHQVMEYALEQARQSVDRTEGPLLDVIAGWLGGDMSENATDRRGHNLQQRAITRFQQLTPPLAAKSVEDTSFYRYGRLLSRNEVGSDPGQFCISVEEFHEANKRRADTFPSSMLATATHDHKRGEDTRARIAALSEMPQEWSETVREWRQINASLRTEVPPENGMPSSLAPQPADELMLYQMLVGAWPLELSANDASGINQLAERIEQWQTKALREAKQVSDWVLPNEEYEGACKRFLQAILTPGESNRFLPKLVAFANKLAPVGAAKGLVQTVLRLTSPGVPDLYQGTDFWDFSLVDPDNRRPVDYASRSNALKDAVATVSNVNGWEKGYLKQQIIRHTLALRAQVPELFARGEYVPLTVSGPLKEHVIAFARTSGIHAAIVIATHLPYPLLEQGGTPSLEAAQWKETAILLPNEWQNGQQYQGWKDIFTANKLDTVSDRVLLSEVLGLLPVSILATEAEANAK